MPELMDTILSKALRGEGVSREKALALCNGAVPLGTLCDAAAKTRERFRGRSVSLCGIANARSGRCGEDCRFCAQSAHHQTDAPVYPLRRAEELYEEARRARDEGARCFGIVTSGSAVAEGEELEEIALAVRRIVRDLNIECSASLGRLTPSSFRRLRAAGLTRYHHNLESSERFFPRLCTTHAWRERRDTIAAAKAEGLSVCAGGLFGIGEGWEDRIDLALALRELEVESVPLNLLHPVPGTPLGDSPLLNPEEALRIVALFRLCLPKAEIRVCGGRDAVLGRRAREIFGAGASGMMIGHYLTTQGAPPAEDRAMLRSLGLDW